MSNTYRKDLAGREDIFFDSNGVNESFLRKNSTGNFQSIAGLNASHLPLLLATRTLELYDNIKMSAEEVDAAITQICASIASIHKFANQDTLDDIESAGSGAIITEQERDKLNKIIDTGSGRIITDAERSKLTEIVGLTQEQIDAILNIGNILPVGTVMGFPVNAPPTGFLECNGAAVSRDVYSDLFGLIGSTYGDGNGTTTFNIPDYRGEFLRGWDHGRGVDPDSGSRTDRGDAVTGDNIGTKQGHEYEAHKHIRGTASTVVGTYGNANVSGDHNDITGTATTSPFTSTEGGNETRPRNVNIMWCIRYSIT